MENITIDSGIREYAINGGGVLRFNPSDPGLYARFLEAEQELKDMENALHSQAQDKNTPEDMLRLTADTDKALKALLEKIFPGNDFHKALGGVSLLAMGGNGQRVIANLLEALEEILTQGAESFAEKQAAAIRGGQ